MAKTQTHPEMQGGVAWMPVSLQPQAPAPVAPLPGGWWLPSLVLLGSGLILGWLLACGINDLRARNAEARANQATQELQANQRAIDNFCKGVAK